MDHSVCVCGFVTEQTNNDMEINKFKTKKWAVTLEKTKIIFLNLEL